MKKFLKITGVFLAFSALISAQESQDYLKNISFHTSWRNRYIDRVDEDSNRIGNAGFKGGNRNRSRWRNTMNGTVVLKDEWGLESNFRLLRNQDAIYGKPSQRTLENEVWETEINFSKNIKLGNLNTKWFLGWENKTNKSRNNKTSGSYKTTGDSNEFYFGPNFNFKLFGQNIDTDIHAVYFNSRNKKTGDYYLQGSELVGGKGEGWGINLNIRNKKDIFKGKMGTVSYGIDLVNKFRATDKKVLATKEKARSNVYMDYITKIIYTTPNFAGFSGEISFENEYEKYTATSGYENTFAIWPAINYKKDFEISTGTITLKPSIRYSALERYTVKTSKSRKTIERNDLRTGITVSYKIKK